jgi:hypothetical protein
MFKIRGVSLIACLAFLLASFSISVATATTPKQINDVVFKTPEESITSYMEGVAQGDLGKILQACAINEISENFKFDLYIERMQALLPQTQSPSDYPFYAELNKVQLSSQISNQVKFLAYSLLSTEAVGEINVIRMDEEQANKFTKEIDPQRLAQLKVEKIGLPDKALMTGDKYLENATKIARIYGADESTERVVLFSFEDNYYLIGFTLLRYGENWKISTQTSAIADISGAGIPKKTTVDEFEGMINGE